MSTLMQFTLAPYSLVFEAGGDYPAERTHKVFQVRDRAASGKIHVETLGVNTKTRTIVFTLMSKTDYDALINWFVNVVNGGEKDFTFTDEYGDAALVKIVDNEITFSETSLHRYSGSLTVEYINA